MQSDVVIIGAGAAGLMCAITAAKRGRKVTVIDHAKKAGKKILISGGGRCNFTNMYTEPNNYISRNAHFCKSALSRFTQWDFISFVDKGNLSWHEKKLGQLFSDEGSKAILNLLLSQCEQLGVKIILSCVVNRIEHSQDHFLLDTALGDIECASLVIATGALSFPTMGATGFGYKIAKQFGIAVTDVQPGLVPFTFSNEERARFVELSGLSVDARVTCNEQSFHESILFTHKGVSGPAILQISSYWQNGSSVNICMQPDTHLSHELKKHQQGNPKKHLHRVLQNYFPQRLIEAICQGVDILKPLQSFKHLELEHIADLFQNWNITPSGTEGYKKAEVTLGGIDTNEISSKTFEAKKVDRLFFIGEVLDVTGQLGGFNFQWAWASGYCAGQHV